MKKEDRFYFEGLFYANQEEFMKAASHFSNSQISPISTERILQHMCKDIALNLFNPYGFEETISNGELQTLCSNAFVDFINNFRKMLEEKKNERS